MAKEKWISSPWTISIGSGVFSLLLTIVYDFFKEKPILSTIWTIIKWLSNLFWSILRDDFLEIALVSDPVNKLSLNRQCVQWIWECESYEYKPMKFKLE